MSASGAWVGAVALAAIVIALTMAGRASGQSMNEIIIGSVIVVARVRSRRGRRG